MSTDEQKAKRKNIIIYNLLFIVVCGGLFLFLLKAPEETTKFLPNDDDHAKFMQMDKKEAEKFCEECHIHQNTAAFSATRETNKLFLFCFSNKKAPSNAGAFFIFSLLNFMHLSI